MVEIASYGRWSSKCIAFCRSRYLYIRDEIKLQCNFHTYLSTIQLFPARQVKFSTGYHYVISVIRPTSSTVIRYFTVRRCRRRRCSFARHNNKHQHEWWNGTIDNFCGCAVSPSIIYFPSLPSFLSPFSFPYFSLTSLGHGYKGSGSELILPSGSPQSRGSQTTFGALGLKKCLLLVKEVLVQLTT